jgi:hypothetical protein
MVFGYIANATRLVSTKPQVKVFAMRIRQPLTARDIARRSGVSLAEIERFNPALRKRVPAGGTVYLPRYVAALGPDVTFWHRPPSRDYTTTLADFMSLDAAPQAWNEHAFDMTIDRFRGRFAATRTEEGRIMETMLAYVLEVRRTSGQRAILEEFQTSVRIRQLFDAARLRQASSPSVTVSLSSVSN